MSTAKTTRLPARQTIRESMPCWDFLHNKIRTRWPSAHIRRWVKYAQVHVEASFCMGFLFGPKTEERIKAIFYAIEGRNKTAWCHVGTDWITFYGIPKDRAEPVARTLLDLVKEVAPQSEQEPV